MLADHIGPSRLVAAGEADEASALRQMVDNCGLLCDPKRILRAHHIAHLADPDVLRDGGPVGVEHAWIGTAFVALGPEMVLDSRDAPEPQVVGGADDVV